jgi:microcompartment protein CcmL/EutN
MEKNMSDTKSGVYLTQGQIAALLFVLDGTVKAINEAIEKGIQEIEDSDYVEREDEPTA